MIFLIHKAPIANKTTPTLTIDIPLGSLYKGSMYSGFTNLRPKKRANGDRVSIQAESRLSAERVLTFLSNLKRALNTSDTFCRFSERLPPVSFCNITALEKANIDTVGTLSDICKIASLKS